MTSELHHLCQITDAVSPRGTMTTSRYDLIEAGLTVVIEARSVPGGLCLTVRPEVSQVSGCVEESRVIESRSMDVDCIVRAGERLVLAALDGWRLAKERRGLGGLYWSVQVGSDPGARRPRTLMAMETSTPPISSRCSARGDRAEEARRPRKCG